MNTEVKYSHFSLIINNIVFAPVKKFGHVLDAKSKLWVCVMGCCCRVGETDFALSFFNGN